MNAPTTLRLTEVFFSLQGETTFTGLPTVFVRLTGCPMRCTYCDTEYAFHGGESRPLAAILEQVKTWPARHVTVTGGEPLAQPECLRLLEALADAGYTVSLETGGAVSTAGVDPRVVTVLDIKTPGSGEAARNHASNWERLRPHDQLKFVLCDRADYDWARRWLDAHPAAVETVDEILFSPSHEQLPARDLAEWILADGLPVRLQLPLHKRIWGSEPGH